MSYLPPLLAFAAVLLGVVGSKPWDGEQATWWRRVRRKGWIAIGLGLVSLLLGLRSARAADQDREARRVDETHRATLVRAKLQAACNPLNRLLLQLATGAIQGPQDRPSWLPEGHSGADVFDGREKSVQIADFLLEHLDAVGRTDLGKAAGMDSSGRAVSRAATFVTMFSEFEKAGSHALTAFAAHMATDPLEALLAVRDDEFARTLRGRCEGLVRGDPLSRTLLPPPEDARYPSMRAGLEAWLRRFRDLADRHGASASGG